MLQIYFLHHDQLSQVGVSPESLKFRNVSIESEKAMVIRDETSFEIKMIDLASKGVSKLPNPNNAIDGAIMHQTSKVIGLRGTFIFCSLKFSEY